MLAVMSDLDAAAARLAKLLAGGSGLRDPSGRELDFEPSVTISPLRRLDPPPQVWAVDGGQALVADARCVALYVTRAATVVWAGGRTCAEEVGELRPHLLGAGEDAATLRSLSSPVAAGSALDVNLLRDWGEWEAVSDAVGRADPGALVLVDGDLQPDWRIPSWWLGSLLESAAARGVHLVGVTKHTSLARGGAPLLGALEAEADASLGDRALWWARVASTRSDAGGGLAVTVARLDPDARFSFRVDLPRAADPEVVLGQLAAVCDDAAFPGYPYPLSMADGLAACGGWVRDDVWDEVSASLERAGIGPQAQERAFADRHRLMERG